MKKTKLLMPILGISAIATAIVPTISSCNDPKEETKGEKVDVKLDAVIDPNHSESQNDIVTVTSKVKEAYTNEDYVLDVTWVQLQKEDRTEVRNTIVSYVLINDADGKTVYTEEDCSDIQYTQTAYGAIKLTIKKERIFEGMQIVIMVRRSEAVKYTNFSVVDDLYDAETQKTAMGLISDPIQLTGTEITFGYQIDLAKFVELVRAKDKDKDIAKDNQLRVYIRANDKTNRICPTKISDIYLNNTSLKYEWIDKPGFYEIRIILDKTVNDVLVESQKLELQPVITGYFDITGGSSAANESQLCVYTPGLVEQK